VPRAEAQQQEDETMTTKTELPPIPDGYEPPNGRYRFGVAVDDDDTADGEWSLEAAIESAAQAAQTGRRARVVAVVYPTGSGVWGRAAAWFTITEISPINPALVAAIEGGE
jgi:hypothetical protein